MQTDESKTSLAGPAYVVLFIYSEVIVAMQDGGKTASLQAVQNFAIFSTKIECIGEVFLSFRYVICSVYVAHSRCVVVRPSVIARISFVQEYLIYVRLVKTVEEEGSIKALLICDYCVHSSPIIGVVAVEILDTLAEMSTSKHLSRKACWFCTDR